MNVYDLLSKIVNESTALVDIFDVSKGYLVIDNTNKESTAKDIMYSKYADEEVQSFEIDVLLDETVTAIITINIGEEI